MGKKCSTVGIGKTSYRNVYSNVFYTHLYIRMRSTYILKADNNFSTISQILYATAFCFDICNHLQCQLMRFYKYQNEKYSVRLSRITKAQLNKPKKENLFTDENVVGDSMSIFVKIIKQRLKIDVIHIHIRHYTVSLLV